MFPEGLCGLDDQVWRLDRHRKSPQRRTSLLGDPRERSSTLGEADRRRDRLSEEAGSLRLWQADDGSREGGGILRSSPTAKCHVLAGLVVVGVSGFVIRVRGPAERRSMGAVSV
jgi:hypothetical protein